jgi:hypothetical protein
MTRLFTCSYRSYRPWYGQAVAISLGLPRWLEDAQQWPRCWLLTPTPALFREPDDEKFAAGYTARLERFGAAKIARTLERIAAEHQAEALVLLCHEPDWSNCHRLTFAQWLLERAGELCQEVGGR